MITTSTIIIRKLEVKEHSQEKHETLVVVVVVEVEVEVVVVLEVVIIVVVMIVVIVVVVADSKKIRVVVLPKSWLGYGKPRGI